MKLHFQKADVQKIAKAKSGKIIIVYDHGVYIMNRSANGKDRVIAYAKGFDPEKNENWYDKKRYVFGGDDGYIVLDGALDYWREVIEKYPKVLTDPRYKSFTIAINRNTVTYGVHTTKQRRK